MLFSWTPPSAQLGHAGTCVVHIILAEEPLTHLQELPVEDPADNGAPLGLPLKLLGERVYAI